MAFLSESQSGSEVSSTQTTHLPNNPKRHINKAIAYDKQGRTYPAVLIGRLGVDKAYQGAQFRIGTQIMILAFAIPGHSFSPASVMYSLDVRLGIPVLPANFTGDKIATLSPCDKCALAHTEHCADFTGIQVCLFFCGFLSHDFAVRYNGALDNRLCKFLKVAGGEFEFHIRPHFDRTFYIDHIRFFVD